MSIGKELFQKLIKEPHLDNETILQIYRDYAFIQPVRVFYAFFTALKIHWKDLLIVLHEIEEAKRDKRDKNTIMNKPVYLLYQHTMKLVLAYQDKLENAIDKMLEDDECENGPMTILLTVQDFYRKFNEKLKLKN